MRLKAPEDEIMATIGYEPPYEGEIDLQLHIGCEQEVSPQELSPVVESILQSALAFVNLDVRERRLGGSLAELPKLSLNNYYLALLD